MPPEYVRRSSRIVREIAILLVGSDMEGKVFSEQTKTVLLSRHGAGIVSQYVLSAEQELILRRLDTDKEVEVRVVGQLGQHGESHTYGVAFLDADDHWPMNRISAQLEAIESPPVADVVFGHEVRFPSEDGRPLAARTGSPEL